MLWTKVVASSTHVPLVLWKFLISHLGMNIYIPAYIPLLKNPINIYIYHNHYTIYYYNKKATNPCISKPWAFIPGGGGITGEQPRFPSRKTNSQMAMKTISRIPKGKLPSGKLT